VEEFEVAISGGIWVASGAREADFENGCGFGTFKGKPFDEVLNFTAFFVSLTPNDLPGKDDAFEIKDGEIIIFKLFSCVSRNEIIQGPNELAIWVIVSWPMPDGNQYRIHAQSKPLSHKP
jgi:hypothetical protein